MTVQDRLRQAGQHIEAEEFDQAESLCADVLKDTNGDTTQLNTKVSGLNFESHRNSDFYTFRITNSIRVSCSINNGGLRLRHYGKHDFVNNNP